MSNESSYHTAIIKGHISELFKDAFTRHGRPELFDSNIDYEKSAFGRARAIFGRAGVEIPMTDRDDLVVDALMVSLREKEIKKFDPKSDDPKKAVAYFIGVVFEGDLRDIVKRYVHDRITIQRPNGDDIDTEMERREETVIPKDPGSLISTDLNRDIFKYMEKKTSKGSVLPNIFYLLTTGKPQKEIGQILEISKGQVSKNVKKVQNLVLDYAKSQKDDFLTELVQTNLSMDTTSAEGATSALTDKDFLNFFKEVDKHYSTKTSSKRSPSGKTVKIQKSRLRDNFSDSYIGEMIMNDSITSKDIEAEMKKYVDSIESMDDLIEDDDSIIALRIMNTGTRQKSSFEY